MIKRILISVAAACMLTAGISASAATVTSVVVSDYNTTQITVEGTINANEKLISLYFEKQTAYGGTPLAGGAIDASNIIIQPVDESTINRETGTFNATFVFTGSGTYNGAAGVKYDVYASNQTTPFEFLFVDKATTNSFIADIADGTLNNTADGSTIYDALSSTYGATVGVDTAYFETTASGSIFTAAEKQAYLNSVVSENAAEIAACYDADGVISDAEAAAAASKTAELAALAQSELMFLDELNDTLVASNVHNALTTYGTSARIAGISTYLGLGTTPQSSVCTGFIGSEYKDMNTFETAFASAMNAAVVGQGQVQGNVTGNTTNSTPGNTSEAVIPSGGDGVNTTGVALLEKYSDIAGVEWAYDAINYVDSKGIMQGVGNKQFAPSEPVLREQVAKIITLAYGEYDANATEPFGDVSSGHWAATYIGSAVNGGLMNGMSADSFGMGRNMTRQDLCTVIYRAVTNLGYNLNVKDESFNDFDSVSDYAKDAVAYLAGAGIITGMGDNTVAPHGTATRAQTAQMLMKVSKLLGIN